MLKLQNMCSETDLCGNAVLIRKDFPYIRQFIPDTPKRAIGRSEVMTPLRHTMCFIYCH